MEIEDSTQVSYISESEDDLSSNNTQEIPSDKLNELTIATIRDASEGKSLNGPYDDIPSLFDALSK